MPPPAHSVPAASSPRRAACLVWTRSQLLVWDATRGEAAAVLTEMPRNLTDEAAGAKAGSSCEEGRALALDALCTQRPPSESWFRSGRETTSGEPAHAFPAAALLTSTAATTTASASSAATATASAVSSTSIAVGRLTRVIGTVVTAGSSTRRRTAAVAAAMAAKAATAKGSICRAKTR
ncbi:hypothetical protein EMIHUDRAFT_361257, partial [Emiliania huxleyi CCMP1516]